MTPLDDDQDPLPLPPLIGRGPEAAPAGPRPPWYRRMWLALPGQLPLLLMALLAGATWWLVQSTPRPPAERAAGAPRHEPDYEMRGFSVQHYQGSGPARGVIEGERVRHYPDTDTLEVDQLQLRWTDDVGHRLQARSGRALVSGDGMMVRLFEGATVTRAPLPGETAPLEFSSDEMVFDRQRDQVRSDRPVRLRQGDATVEARTLVYDHADGRLDLRGAVKGRLPVRRR